MVTLDRARAWRLDDSVAQVLRHPRPWIVRYVLATLPSLALSLLLLLPLRAWFRYPLFVEALETRSLDHLLEVLETASADSAAGPLLILILLVAPLAWLLVRALWAFFEGGVLATYAGAGRLSWGEFFRACWRWFGALCVLGIFWFLSAAMIAVLAGVSSVLLRTLWMPLGLAMTAAGGVGVVVLWLWFSTARSVAVVRNDPNVFRALGNAARAIRRRRVAFLGVFVGALALQLLLVLASRGVTTALAHAWWPVLLLFQQLVTVLGIGVTLTRRACEVGLAAHVFADYQASGPGELEAAPGAYRA